MPCFSAPLFPSHFASHTLKCHDSPVSLSVSCTSPSHERAYSIFMHNSPPHQQLYGLLGIYTHRGAHPCIFPTSDKHIRATLGTLWSSSRLPTLGTLSSSSRLLLIFPRSRRAFLTRRAFLNKSFARALPHQQLYGLLGIRTHRGAHPCILPNIRKHARANSSRVRKIVPVSWRTGVYVPRSHAHARAKSKYVRN